MQRPTFGVRFAHLFLAAFALATLARAGDRAQELTNQGRAALSRRDYVGASEILGSAFEAAPKNAEIAFLYGLALFGCDRFDDAVVPFEVAANSLPQDALPQQFLARTYHKVGRSEDAIATFHRALALEPGDPSTFNHLGAVYLELDRSAEALEMFQQAIALDTDYGSAHFNAGVTLFLLGKQTEAQLHLERAIALDPTDSDAALILGDLLSGMGEKRKARDAYAIAAERLPESVPARARVFRMDRELRDLASAEHRMREVAEQVARDADLWHAVADLALERGNLDAAERALERALEVAPDSVATVSALADLSEDRSDLVTARRWLERWNELDPGNADIGCRLSSVCERLGDEESAREIFRRSVEQGDPVGSGLRCVAQRMLDSELTGIRNRALGYQIATALAQRSDGKDASLLVLLGRAEIVRGEVERAALAYEQAAALFVAGAPAAELLRERAQELRSKQR